MTLLSKIKWVASILLVFLIVLITNLIDKDNFSRLKNAVTTIYDDRIVANDILFDLNNIIHQKQLGLATSDTLFFKNVNTSCNARIEALLTQYDQTELTDKEQSIYSALKTNIATCKTLEEEFTENNFRSTTALEKSYSEIAENLQKLSKVQLKEGKQQVFISNKAIDTIDLFTQGEIIFLVVMGVLIQVIILYKPKNK